ncbi:rhomboid family intramembrane serine protease [Candidatus Curtissbacteria bacterium]|nr:rhomboid family intramembrane serine protease [Candidatus Curtissbacteria bacterium]
MPIRDHNPSNKFPFITITLIAINLYVFYLQLTAPSIEGFIYQYALVPASIDFKNFDSLYPFITALFLHGGFIHLGSNMLFLWVFGDNIEAALGHIKFLVFYLFAGVIASLTQYLLLTGSNIPQIGASGAIAGVLGAYLILFPKARIDVLIPLGLFPVITAVPAYLMLLYWFVTQLFSGAASVVTGVAGSGGIAFFAHIGGFVGGILLINILKPKKLLS